MVSGPAMLLKSMLGIDPEELMRQAREGQEFINAKMVWAEGEALNTRNQLALLVASIERMEQLQWNQTEALFRIEQKANGDEPAGACTSFAPDLNPGILPAPTCCKEVCDGDCGCDNVSQAIVLDTDFRHN
jgi:hypothetical protein